MAILAASACSRDYSLSPSGVDEPGVPLSDSGKGVTAQADCSLTQGFWKNHEEVWPVEELILGGATYTKPQLLAILRTSPRGDATYILIHQFIAANLNLADRADLYGRNASCRPTSRKKSGPEVEGEREIVTPVPVLHTVSEAHDGSRRCRSGEVRVPTRRWGSGREGGVRDRSGRRPVRGLRNAGLACPWAVRQPKGGRA